MLSLQYRLLFIHLTVHACCWRADSHQRPNTPSSSGRRLVRVMTTQKYFTLGAGSAFCGSVNGRPEQQRHVIQSLPPSHPLLSLHFSWYQQTERWIKESTGELLCTANTKCTYCFPPSQWGPQPLLRTNGFTPLFICSDDYSLTISKERSTQIIYLSKIEIHSHQ